MKIRNMKIDDYDKVYELWINTPNMGLNNIDDSKEGINKFLMRNPTTCFVAEIDKIIIGAIIAGHDGRRGYIYHTAVKISENGKGIGKSLVNNALKALKEEGINKVALVVFNKNKSGNDFWENLDFISRKDLVYRNKEIKKIIRIDT